MGSNRTNDEPIFLKVFSSDEEFMTKVFEAMGFKVDRVMQTERSLASAESFCFNANGTYALRDSSTYAYNMPIILSIYPESNISFYEERKELSDRFFEIHNAIQDKLSIFENLETQERKLGVAFSVFVLASLAFGILTIASLVVGIVFLCLPDSPLNHFGRFLAWGALIFGVLALILLGFAIYKKAKSKEKEKNMRVIIVDMCEKTDLLKAIASEAIERFGEDKPSQEGNSE